MLSNKLRTMIDKEYGEFVDHYQPIRDIEEFTDIRHTTIQSLLNWASETGTDFENCVQDFLKDFRAEVKYLRARGPPATMAQQWDGPSSRDG